MTFIRRLILGVHGPRRDPRMIPSSDLAGRCMAPASVQHFNNVAVMMWSFLFSRPDIRSSMAAPRHIRCGASPGSRSKSNPVPFFPIRSCVGFGDSNTPAFGFRGRQLWPLVGNDLPRATQSKGAFAEFSFTGTGIDYVGKRPSD